MNGGKVSDTEKTAMNEKPPRTPLQPLAYTMQQTAELLGVSYMTVHRLLKRKLLHANPALRHKMITRAEIDRFLKL